jgi:zinc and cadmium transporter
MTAAALLTVLALLGVFAGSILGQSRALSVHLAAAGGGLLFGIAMFWLLPEIAETMGWWLGAGVAAIAAGLLLGLDWFLDRIGHSPRHGVLGPLMAATAVHSFLDGWSVSALGIRPMASVTVTLGLALHKVPEGLALGWINRKTTGSAARAIVISSAVEMVTLAGAFVEPKADRSGEAAFGPMWTAAVLAVVGGSFLFLASHTVWPERKKAGVLPIFAAGFALIGAFSWIKQHG